MKALFTAVVLMMVILFVSASMAQIVVAGERVQIPSTLSLVPMTTTTGKTVIEIDAQVQVPDDEGLAFYSVAPRSFSEEEIRVMAQGFGFSADVKLSLEQHGDTGSDFKGYAMDYYLLADGTRKMHVYNGYMRKEPAGASVRLEQTDATAEYAFSDKLLPMAADLDAPAQKALDAARSLAVAIAGKVAPGLSLNMEGMLTSSPIVFGDVSLQEDSGAPGSYAQVFEFSRVLAGVPVTITGTMMGSDNKYMPSLPEERLSLVIDDSGLVAAQYSSPYDIERGEAIDAAALLPFQAVVDIARRMLPLMCLPQESSQASADLQERLTINRIAFGYVRTNVRNQPGKYQLVPAWDFFGTALRQARLYEKGEHVVRAMRDNYAADSYLTINALTGDVIDRTLGY